MCSPRVRLDSSDGLKASPLNSTKGWRCASSSLILRT
jgi:hypothetical protein